MALPETLPADQDEETLVAVLEQCLRDLEAGRPVPTARILDEHPAIADRLRTCLAGLELLDGGTAPRAGGDTAGGGRPQIGGYSIVREIGRGGMGIVYEAIQESQGRSVALKVIPLAAALDSRQLLRFKIEVEAATRLHHPRIVPVLEFGCSGGVHFYTMPLVAGESLAVLVRRRQDVNGTGNPLSDARLALQAAEALDYAHQVGVVHRDIKPANLLVDREGQLFITDFGLASVQGTDGATATGDVIGTLRYMSPEQAAAGRGVVDHRTDIYSLGATLYELLTLRPAISADNPREMAAQLALAEPTPPRRLDPSIPAALETITLKALAKSPAQRYQHAADMAADLRRFLAGERIHARPPSLVTRLGNWAQRRRRLVASITLAAILALIGLATSTALVWQAWRDAEHHRLEAEARELDSRRNLYTAHLHLAQNEWQAGRVSRVLELLDQEQPLAGQKDMRHFEWHHLQWLAQHARRHAWTASPRAIHAIAVSEKLWAVSGADGTIGLWDPSSRALRPTLRPGAGAIHGLALSPDGQLLAAACDDGSVQLWDVASGERAAALLGGMRPATAVAFASDQTLLSCGNQRVYVWNIEGRRLQGEFHKHTSNIKCLAVSSGGQHFATAGHDKHVLLWNLDALEREPIDLGRHSSYLYCLAFTPDGQTLLSGSEDGYVVAWDVTGRAPPRRFPMHTSAVAGLALLPGGERAASAGWDGGLRLWKIETGEVILQQGQRGKLHSVASIGGGLLLTGGDDGSLRIYDSQARREPLELRGHTQIVRSLAFVDSGQALLSASADGIARLWNLASGMTTAAFERTTDDPPPVWPDDLAGSVGSPSWLMGAVMVAGSGQVVTADSGGRLRRWDGDGSELAPLAEAGSPLWSLALSPDERTLAAAGYTSCAVTLWDVPTGRIRAVLKGHTERTWCAQFSPDGKLLASGGNDRIVRVWDVASGEQRGSLPIPAEFVFALAFSPDGKTLAAAGDDWLIRRWEVADGRELAPLGPHPAGVRALAFFPDGRTIATGGDDAAVRLWDVETRLERATLRISGRSIWSLAVAPGGHSLAAGDMDGVITVWRARQN
jgi:WD40 repeat protein/serine/threonine protein kinase